MMKAIPVIPAQAGIRKNGLDAGSLLEVRGGKLYRYDASTFMGKDWGS